MMASIIIFACLALLLFGFATWSDESRGFSFAWGCMFTILSVLMACLAVSEGTYKEGNIDGMNDIHKYERRFVISEADSVVTDTLYFKIQ